MKNKNFRSGIYVTVISLIVIAAAIAINVLVKSMDVKEDLTANGKYSLTEETKNMLGGIHDDIRIYYLTKNKETVSWLEIFFKLYEKECKSISVEYVDLIVNPSFPSRYTSEKVQQNSIIIDNKTTGRSRYVPYEDLLIIENSMDYNTFQYTQSVTGVDIEGQINSAIDYVTTGVTRKMYALLGHGETVLGEEAIAYLRRSNIEYATLELISAGKVPEDCDVLYISMPVNDYSETEIAAITEYTDHGGNLLINAYNQAGNKNLASFMESYGVTPLAGIIMEDEAEQHMANYKYYLLPSVLPNEITSRLPLAKHITVPQADVLLIDKNVAGDFKFATLLTTSDKSYLKVPNANGEVLTQEKQKGDRLGPFCIGVYVQNQTTNSSVIMFSGAGLFMDEFFINDTYSNAELLTNSLNYLMGVQETALSVRKIMFNEEPKLDINSADAVKISLIMAGAIPAVLLALGIIIMVRRRYR